MYTYIPYTAFGETAQEIQQETASTIIMLLTPTMHQ